MTQNIRNLVGINTDGLTVDGIPVRGVSKEAHGYAVKLGTGEIIPAKGHQKIEDLRRSKPVSSHARIRQYGEFGSTIN